MKTDYAALGKAYSKKRQTAVSAAYFLSAPVLVRHKKAASRTFLPAVIFQIFYSLLNKASACRHP